MLYINEWSVKMLKDKYPCPDYLVSPYCPPGSWQTSRYVQIFIDGYDRNLHYEYRIDGGWNGRVELHFEGEDWETKYGALIDRLMNDTQNSDDLTWSEWGYGYRCQHTKTIDNIEDLFQAMSYMMELFGKLIRDFTKETPTIETRTILSDMALPSEDVKEEPAVELFEKKYGEILRLPLTIPNYQRIYCWEENNVKCLLEDVFEHISANGKTPYRLGTIILHSHDGKYDVIDGQQRLVTLALLLSETGVKTSLLNEKFSSQLSQEYVAYNKHIIHEYVHRHLSICYNVDRLLNLLEFSVLVLQNTSIDLAYTFFSNQNSRGVALTDYDLLKAHHLRYIPSNAEQQSRRAAELWNRMIEDGRDEKERSDIPDYVRTLDTYIYRLRKWMRKNECEDSTDNYRIKREYEAAPVMDEIPPFGERFYFSEPIQGGMHFFSFVEQHLNKFRQFSKTEEYTILHSTMQGGSDQWYRDVVESVLFCYFLKFGEYFLSDALAVIMRVLLQHRYENMRAVKASIVQYAGDSELVLMIDQATSPTFFLAEARNVAKELSYPARQRMSPIMRSMRTKAANITGQLRHNIVVESFKNLNR